MSSMVISFKQMYEKYNSLNVNIALRRFSSGTLKPGQKSALNIYHLQIESQQFV